MIGLHQRLLCHSANRGPVGGGALPPCGGYDPAGEYDGVRECDACDLAVDQDAHLAERALAKRGARWEVRQELVRDVEVLRERVSVAANVLRPAADAPRTPRRRFLTHTARHKLRLRSEAG